MYDDVDYKRIFKDICFGSSEYQSDFGFFYIKHLNNFDRIHLQEKESLFLSKAVDRGLPSEGERMQELKKDNLWTIEDESFIESQTLFIKNLNETKSNLLLKSERDNYQITITEETEKLNKKLSEKQNLLGNTSEQYANNQLNEYYIIYTFFKDKNFKEPLFTQLDYDNLNYSEISHLIKINNSHIEETTEYNIQKMVLDDFYFTYLQLTNSPQDLFGKPLFELTNLQLSTLMFTRIFKNIFDNVENIPEKLRKDPVGLLDFASNSKNKQKVTDQLEKDGATTVFGATKDDYESLGVSASDVNKNSLSNKLKEKGGTLSMQDLMNLS